MKVDKSLVDGAHRRLRRDIIDGRLHAGAKLKLESLAAVYDIGMSPLREALSRLIGESLVVSESQRGFWVAPLSVAQLDDLTRVRLMIECEALSLSITLGDAGWQERVTAAFTALTQIEVLKPLSGELPPAPEWLNQWEELNNRFHSVLVDACGSPILIQLRERLYHQSERYRRISVDLSADQRDVHEEHAALYEATLNRNVLKASRVLERHLFATSNAVRASMLANVP